MPTREYISYPPVPPIGQLSFDSFSFLKDRDVEERAVLVKNYIEDRFGLDSAKILKKKPDIQNPNNKNQKYSEDTILIIAAFYADGFPAEDIANIMINFNFIMSGDSVRNIIDEYISQDILKLHTLNKKKTQRLHSLINPTLENKKKLDRIVSLLNLPSHLSLFNFHARVLPGIHVYKYGEVGSIYEVDKFITALYLYVVNNLPQNIIALRLFGSAERKVYNQISSAFSYILSNEAKEKIRELKIKMGKKDSKI